MDTAAAPRRRFDVVAYLKLFRFPLVFTAIADSAAGYLLLSGGGNIEYWVLGLLAIASSGLYFFGMAMNDIADLERDRQLAPTRVLPSGRISKSNAVYAALIALALSLEAVIWLGVTGYFLQVIIPWIAAVAAIVSYDLHLFKVPPMMGIVRSSNLLLGVCVSLSIGNMDSSFPRWLCALIAAPQFIYVTGLAYVSTLEDKEVHGARIWVGVGVMILAAFFASWLVSGLALAYLGFDRLRSIRTPWIALGLSALLSAWLLQRARKAKDRKGVMLLVRDGIAGIILLDTILVASGIRFPDGADRLWCIGIAALLIPAALSVAVFKKLA